MILRTQPNDPWETYDFLLLEAYYLMKQESCKQCGLPRWMCHGESNTVQFKVVEDTCAAMVEIERKQEKASKGKQPKGTQLKPKPFFVDGETWVSVRENYYADVARQAANEG